MESKVELYQKMFKVMEGSTGLDKTMNVGGKYNAISEASVLNTIKPLLKDNKLIIFPIKVDVNESDSRKMTQVIARYKIVDVETGQSEELEAVGNGVDTQDKASGKAWTYAYKALLQKTFCLFSGEDTDNTHSDEITQEMNMKRELEESKPTEADINTLIKIVEGKGGTKDKLESSIKKTFGKTLDQINNREYGEYLRVINEAKKDGAK